ncbi:MAG: ABC transporter permease [Gemmatimonadota bacterium]|nr:ABC transporter permease [Gemmatimonadota bacterium]MDE3215318.1 ABC transporter permease [Gemmatimonadota bacterium]
MNGRLRAQLEETILPPIVALLIAALVGDLLILVYGQSPAAVYRLLIQGTWGNAYGLGQVLYKTTTLTFTGLAVAIGLQAGLFNIGAESQLAAGGFAAGVVGAMLPAGIPSVVLLPLFIAAAAIGGGLVGGAAGALKAKWGAHEVITTIMLNFVVLALLNYLTVAHFKVFDTLHTADIRSGALPRLSAVVPAFHGSAANVVLVLALAAVAAAWWYLYRSRAGYELRAAGLQPGAAEYGGVKVSRVWWQAMLLSGAVAGIGGLNFVLGYKHYYEDSFASGMGFLGIAVALVGRNNPLGVFLAALLFATLSQGGLAVNAVVPKQMVEVLQAVVIIAVATSVPEVRRLLRGARRSAAT